MDIGARLKIAREAIGYTLQKVAEKTMIGESSISEFEHSKREPKFSQLSALAEIYKKPIEYFLTDKNFVPDLMLWREPPIIEEKGEIEAQFRLLCEQYHKLEILMGETSTETLPQTSESQEEFDYKKAERLAENTHRIFGLGEIPSTSLRHILEERFHVKIFHLAFQGSAISNFSEAYGPAILLNNDTHYRTWRRNFDLAHELFHLLTWKIFRNGETESMVPGNDEEKLANAFASRLLLPTDMVKERIDKIKNKNGRVSLESLDEVAREFGVSLDALLWRLLYLYDKSANEIEGYIDNAKTLRIQRPSRISDQPDELPERYCSLAIKALNEGKLSLIQFAKYMGIGYKKAQEYLREERPFMDEEDEIFIT